MSKERAIEKPSIEEMEGAIRVLADSGEESSLRVLCIVDRLMKGQWSPLSRVLDSLESTLDSADKSLAAAVEDTAIL